MGKEVVPVPPRTRRLAVFAAVLAVPVAAVSILAAAAAQANGTHTIRNVPHVVRHDVRAPGYVTPVRRAWPQPSITVTTRPTTTAPATTAAPPPATTTSRTSSPPAVVTTTTLPRTTTPPPPTPPRTSTVLTSTAPAGIVAEPSYATAVLNMLNSERSAHGLPALTSNAKLVCSAYHHNLAMAQANTMSHQLPGEPDVGGRESACGYTWTRWAENVGWSTDLSVNGATSLETAMYNEVPPNDGHRQNILSPSLTQIGVNVIIDNAHHKVWLTEDFGTP